MGVLYSTVFGPTKAPLPKGLPADPELKKGIGYVQRAINEATLKHGTFASSALVNGRARLISDKLFQGIATHFRQLGYVVHAPTPLAKWLEALREAERNDLTMMRFYQEISLGNVLLVELPSQERPI